VNVKTLNNKISVSRLFRKAFCRGDIVLHLFQRRLLKGSIMLLAVGTITVQVSNQDAALKFYTEKLDFEKRRDMPMSPGQRWLEVAPKNATTRILLYKATKDMPGADSYEAALASIGKSTSLVLETDDIVKTFIELKARGVKIIDEPVKQPYGWWGVFADQDGNTYGVHQ
jgi:lactoylglutathione lyase